MFFCLLILLYNNSILNIKIYKSLLYSLTFIGYLLFFYLFPHFYQLSKAFLDFLLSNVRLIYILFGI